MPRGDGTGPNGTYTNCIPNKSGRGFGYFGRAFGNHGNRLGRRFTMGMIAEGDTEFLKDYKKLLYSQLKLVNEELKGSKNK